MQQEVAVPPCCCSLSPTFYSVHLTLWFPSLVPNHQNHHSPEAQLIDKWANEEGTTANRSTDHSTQIKLCFTLCLHHSNGRCVCVCVCGGGGGSHSDMSIGNHTAFKTGSGGSAMQRELSCDFSSVQRDR